MTELENEFVRQSVADLEEVSRNLRAGGSAGFPEELWREAFRRLHTIKGTAQTFGFPAAGRLAHALENLLETGARGGAAFSDSSAAELKAVFLEGVGLLIGGLARKDFEVPDDFTGRVQKFRTDKLRGRVAAGRAAPAVPEEISAQLSAREKSVLTAALETGMTPYVLEIGFAVSNFAEEFRDFWDELSEKGPIVAVLPCPRFSERGKIGFRIIFTTAEDIDDMLDAAAEETGFLLKRLLTDDLAGVCARIAAYGETLAEELQKKIVFKVSAENRRAAPRTLKTIFDALLHLVRNAVGHGIGREGEVKIKVKFGEDDLQVTVADDGLGIDTEKVRAAALEKNLAPADRELSAREVLDLIFLPGLSTAGELTEISGRGVGLDAVRDAVEKAGGRISVRSRKGRGTIFEIVLPREG